MTLRQRTEVECHALIGTSLTFKCICSRALQQSAYQHERLQMTSPVNLDDPYLITNWICTVRWYLCLIIDLMLKLHAKEFLNDISWYHTNKFTFAGKSQNPKQWHIKTMRVGTKYWLWAASVSRRWVRSASGWTLRFQVNSSVTDGRRAGLPFLSAACRTKV